MSKIIKKNDITKLVESTMKQAGLLKESENMSYMAYMDEEEMCEGAGCADYMEEEEHMDEADAKPDFLDLDKDGDKEESMKKAAKDKEESLTEGVIWDRLRDKWYDLVTTVKSLGHLAVSMPNLVNLKASGDAVSYYEALSSVADTIEKIQKSHPNYELTNKFNQIKRELEKIDMKESEMDVVSESVKNLANEASKHNVISEGLKNELDKFRKITNYKY